eukprot:6033360-Alexandrium_andersonii.AAC.1
MTACTDRARSACLPALPRLWQPHLQAEVGQNVLPCLCVHPLGVSASARVVGALGGCCHMYIGRMGVCRVADGEGACPRCLPVRMQLAALPSPPWGKPRGLSLVSSIHPGWALHELDYRAHFPFPVEPGNRGKAG